MEQVSSEQQKSPEQLRQENLLSLINNSLDEIGVKARYLKLPEYMEEYKTLTSKKVLIVDDISGVVENVLPTFMVATSGTASGLVYSDTYGAEVIVQKILEKSPDILLLDYHLSEIFKGDELLAILRSKGFQGSVFGTSSDREVDSKFLRAGVVANVDKTAYPTSELVLQVASFFN